MCQSQRASAPAGVNICFRNLNNRPTVICISDNGPPYGSVDPRCAKALSLCPHPFLFFIYRIPCKSFHQDPSVFCIFFPLFHFSICYILYIIYIFVLFLQTSFCPSSTKPWPWRTTQSRDPCYHSSSAWDIHFFCPAQFPASDRKRWHCMSGIWIKSTLGSAFTCLKSCCSPVRNNQLVTPYYLVAFRSFIYLIHIFWVFLFYLLLF